MQSSKEGSVLSRLYKKYIGDASGAGMKKEKMIGLTRNDAKRKQQERNPKIIFGEGVVKVGRREVHIDESIPNIKASETYVPFGRFILNHHRLNQDDVMMMRYAKGGAIRQVPTQKVSKVFVKTLRTILNGQNPSFTEIYALDEDERNHLYEIIRLAKLEDKIIVPEPCQIDKDINDFERYKGEIIAGNDNAGNIKKFKLLTLKLKNQARLPYREANNILVDLPALGY